MLLTDEQTNKQTNKQTNATKNIISLVEIVIIETNIAPNKIYEGYSNQYTNLSFLSTVNV